MFQGPKGYIAQICEVHLQYGKLETESKTKERKVLT